MTISLSARDVGRQCCQSGKGTTVGACGIVEDDFSFADQHQVICCSAVLRCRPYPLHRWNYKRAISTAMMAITTSNSIRVKPELEEGLLACAVCMLSSLNPSKITIVPIA